MKPILTYAQAYDRIVTAYFKDRLDPYHSRACFIGNLLGGSDEWNSCRTTIRKYTCEGDRSDRIPQAVAFVNSFGYTDEQITILEINFLSILNEINFDKALEGANNKRFDNVYTKRRFIDNEDLLFDAMSSTLDMLRKIHEDAGEVIDAPKFTKRELA